MRKKDFKFKIKAFEYDLARNLVADMSSLENTVDNLAEFGVNMMAINLEYRFDFSSCPGLAPPGALTLEKTRKLSDYARKKGIEIVPIVNLVGHCEGINAIERYAEHSVYSLELRQWGGYEQLNLERAETRNMIRGMVADICQAFRGDYVHIGCDEIRRMDYLFPEDEKKQKQKVEEYMFFIIEEFSKYDKQLLVWGDMLLKYPNILSRMPREVIICDWCYEPEGRTDSLRRFRDEGFRVLSCPAVPSFNAFSVEVEQAEKNITKMISDAKELKLEGFMLTTWQAGFGTSMNLVWPFTAFAVILGEGHAKLDMRDFLSSFAESRYGCNGKNFVQLFDSTDKKLSSLLNQKGFSPGASLRLRCAIFRGALLSYDIIRPEKCPTYTPRDVWEPSPFRVWHYLRAIINNDFLDRFKELADNADRLQKKVFYEAEDNKEELTAITTLCRSLKILSDRLNFIEDARENYHCAALVQLENSSKFHEYLNKAILSLEMLRPGLHELKELLVYQTKVSGMDPNESHWIDIHEQSLNEHIEFLRKIKNTDDSLLEFGHFLLRPANIKTRVIWR
jgi:glycosyl hydrolase family 20